MIYHFNQWPKNLEIDIGYLPHDCKPGIMEARGHILLQFAPLVDNIFLGI